MTRICILAVLTSFFAWGIRGDTIELKTGERIDGTFKQATSAGAVIEVGGQQITISLEKVHAIYFGASSARVSTTVAPYQEALDALKALRSVTESGLSYRDYAPRVLDTKIKVDRFLSSSTTELPPVTKGVQTALREYELAGQAWNLQGDLSTWRNLDSELLTKCPALAKIALKIKMASDFQVLGLSEQAQNAAKVDGQSAPAALWKCAAAQITEIEGALAHR